MPLSVFGAGSTQMHGAMVPIAYAVASSSADRVGFSNIPAAYQDLFIVSYSRTQQSSTQSSFQFYVNGDVSGIYSYTYLQGDGSSATSSRTTNQGTGFIGNTVGDSATSGIFGSSELHILNYANTSTYKTFLSRSAADVNGSGTTQLSVTTYRSTAAINQIVIGAFNTYNFVTGTTFALYGVRTVGQ